ncbi:hypothetical protein QBC35DRAFT_531860 [Podospora australis]|uniref:Uncharacterized protein n=1 Tax=Podospora australis TaxID=1536484 RepID=A0AAN6WXI7_9PEZI|nr:hypothetical protein QBC35DRAFT_531860 [Podospora australis]
MASPVTYPVLPYSSSNLTSDWLTFNNAVWSNAFTSAPVGSSRVPGKNMTLQYQANSNSDDWTYTLRISDTVPTPGKPEGEFVTGTWLQIEAPKNLLKPSPRNTTEMVVPQDNSWQACSLVFWGPNLKSDKPLSGSGCNGFLPPVCINDLKKHFREGWNNPSRNGNLPGYVYCPAPYPRNLPASCNENVTFGEGRVGSYKNTTSSPLGQGVFDILKLADTSTIHKAANTTAFEEMTKRVYVIGTIWGYSASSGLPNGTEVSTEVTCLRAGSAASAGQDQVEDQDRRGVNGGVEDQNQGGGEKGGLAEDKKSAAGLSFKKGSLLLLRLQVSVFTSYIINPSMMSSCISFNFSRAEISRTTMPVADPVVGKIPGTFYPAALCCFGNQ